MFIGLGTDFWGNSIFVLPENMNRIDAEFLNQFIKLLPVIVTILGFSLSFLCYTFFNNFLFKLKISTFGNKIYIFLNKKWFFDKIFNEYLSQNILNFGYRISYKIIDRGIIEIFGPLGLTTIISKKANFLYKLQSGVLYHYTLLILISTTFILGSRYFWLYFIKYIDFRIFILFFLFCSYLFLDKNK
jgi:NADH-ubiquinone oxidoreductase chain 5